MKKFFNDFKKFISRGNIVDMAVGVIIGSAFSAIVTAFTNKIIMPFINLLLSIGGTNGLETAYTVLKAVYLEDGTLDLNKSIYIDWGAFITAIINFFIIAFTLFLILKVAMKSSEMFKKGVGDLQNSRITRSEKKQLVANGVDLKDHRAVKVAIVKLREENARIEKEKKEKEDLEFKLAHPTQEDLLKEIRDLLKENNKPKDEKSEENK